MKSDAGRVTIEDVAARAGVSIATMSRAGVGDTVDVSAVVTNTGERCGDEVVQVYRCDPVSSITRPVRELIGFRRVALDPGESATVTFHVPVAALGSSGRDLSYVVEPGDFEFWVGASSSDTVLAGTVVVVGDAPVSTVRASATSTTLTHADPTIQVSRS